MRSCSQITGPSRFILPTLTESTPKASYLLPLKNLYLEMQKAEFGTFFMPNMHFTAKPIVLDRTQKSKKKILQPQDTASP